MLSPLPGTVRETGSTKNSGLVQFDTCFLGFEGRVPFCNVDTIFSASIYGISTNGQGWLSCEFWVLWPVACTQWSCFWNRVLSHDPEAFFLSYTNAVIATFIFKKNLYC